jgi:hypothetical protein
MEFGNSQLLGIDRSNTDVFKTGFAIGDEEDQVAFP